MTLSQRQQPAGAAFAATATAGRAWEISDRALDPYTYGRRAAEAHTAGASAARAFRLGTTQVHQAGVPVARINNIGTATGPQNTRAERGYVGAAGGAGGPALLRERRTVENTAACSARPAAGPCPVAIPWLHAGGGREGSRRRPTTHRCSGGVLRHVLRDRALQVPLQGCHARGADKGGRRGDGHREEGAGPSPAEPALGHGPGGPCADSEWGRTPISRHCCQGCHRPQPPTDHL
ncbi:hypothetical protein HPB51_029426 [Rhipicephalus microplus]|uniref:Uncharacterized protein n=1 Tax=Rhipicephalus microplus TaxID=6941 RepID=A0A9J6CUX0_RHIMP|nr:hypothetical protein HPB51_029426 [Rhipicephalus microplus]